MSPLELRESDGRLTLRGHASVFNHWYPVETFRERILPGAFTRTLQEAPDVSLLINHGRSGSGLPLARSTAGTLKLSEDREGLAVTADLDPRDADVQLLKTKMDNRAVGEMSFAFRAFPGGQQWDKDYKERTLTALDLAGGDVSVCTSGANDATSASIRAGVTLGIEERRARAREIGLAVRGSTPSGITVVRSAGPDPDCARCAGVGEIVLPCPNCSVTGDVESASAGARRKRKGPTTHRSPTARQRLDLERARAGSSPTDSVEQRRQALLRQLEFLRRRAR